MLYGFFNVMSRQSRDFDDVNIQTLPVLSEYLNAYRTRSFLVKAFESYRRINMRF